MKIENRVKQFKADLKSDSNRPNEFNAIAFLFSALYFLYIGMYKYFLVFAALPFILIFILTHFFNTGAEIFVGIFLAHITAAFVANQRVREYKEKYVKLFEHTDTSRPVEYFSMSLIRLVTCTFLSGGLYSIYWGYRNWNIYQKTTRDNINPNLMAFLFNFTSIFLFSKIRQTTKEEKSFLPQGIACMVIFLFEILIVQGFVRNAISGWLYTLCAIVLLTLMLAYPFCLVPVQKSINKYTVEVLNKRPNKYYSPWELFFLLAGIVMNLAIWFGNYFLKNNTFTEAQAKKVSDAISFIYRNTEGYSSVCKKEGYIMKTYPKIFKNLYAREIASLSHELEKRGYTLEEAQEELITTQTEDIKNSIRNELEQLRKIWIMYDISEDNGIPVRNLDWIDDYDEQMSLKEACAIFDEKGISMLQNSGDRDFLKSKALH